MLVSNQWRLYSMENQCPGKNHLFSRKTARNFPSQLPKNLFGAYTGIIVNAVFASASALSLLWLEENV
jgi:hypothetical protein